MSRRECKRAQFESRDVAIFYLPVSRQASSSRSGASAGGSRVAIAPLSSRPFIRLERFSRVAERRGDEIQRRATVSSRLLPRATAINASVRPQADRDSALRSAPPRSAITPCSSLRFAVADEDTAS